MPKSRLQKKKEYKPKLCKVCKKKFQPVFGLQRVCCYQCGIEDHRIAKQKAAEKRLRKEDKDVRERLKSRSDWLREAQREFNKYIRLRDNKYGCISCGRHHQGQYHGGHYRSVGACPELRFEESNCHKQCAPCNNHKSGNIVEYRINLIKRIGLEKVEWLEGPHKAKKYSVEEIKEIKKKYAKKARELEKSIQIGL